MPGTEPAPASDRAETAFLALAVAAVAAAAVAATGVTLAFFTSRVSYLCLGESPRPCTCFREGEEPSGFEYNRISQGPGAWVMRSITIALGVALVCALLATAFHLMARRRPELAEHGRLFTVILGFGAVLAVSAGFLWMAKALPSPCEDQGAWPAPQSVTGVLVQVPTVDPEIAVQPTEGSSRQQDRSRRAG